MLYKLNNEEKKDMLIFNKLPFNIQIMYNKLTTVFDAEDKVVYVNDDNTCIVTRNGKNPIWVYCADYRELDNVIDLLLKLFKETPEDISVVTDAATMKYIKYSLAELHNDLSLIACKKDWLMPYYCTKVNDRFKDFKYNVDCNVITFDDNNFNNYYTDIFTMQKEFFEYIGKPKTDEELEKRVNNLIDEKSKLYLLINSEFKAVSMCITRKHFNFNGLCGVVTAEQYKGNHYSTDLVAEVTKRIIEHSDLPVLYAQSENKISNSMYQNIGYIKSWELVQYINKRGK